MQVERHPLAPFYPAHARLLMLGSFPPGKERWAMDFYYPNLQNDMWRIFGWVFFRDKDYFLTGDKKTFIQEKIENFLSEKGIALSDTAREVIRQRGNASDKFLQIVKPIDMSETLDLLPECKAIVTTGQKATDILVEIIKVDEPKVGGCSLFELNGRRMCLYRMPSSSRAYPKPLQEKAVLYEKMFRETGILK